MPPITISGDSLPISKIFCDKVKTSKDYLYSNRQPEMPHLYSHDTEFQNIPFTFCQYQWIFYKQSLKTRALKLSELMLECSNTVLLDLSPRNNIK